MFFTNSTVRTDLGYGRVSVMHGSRCRFLLAAAYLCLASATQAQDLPTDSQMQAAFGVSYNHFGLLEYCRAKGFVTDTDVANARHVVTLTVQGMSVSAAARAEEEPGRHGEIIGPQVIGLIDASNPARPEKVDEGHTMTLADNARAQKSTERTLCQQMAAQAAPLN